MEEGQNKHRTDNHGALQNHEGDLLVRQLAMETGLQLRTPEHRPHKDGQCGKAQCPQEGLEPESISQHGEVDVALAFRSAGNSPSKLSTEKGENAERANLAAHTGNHDVDAHLIRAGGIGARSNRATDGLEEKRDEVKGDEGDGVESRCKARQILAICDNYPGEAEIDGCREECGPDGQADEIPGRDGSVTWAWSLADQESLTSGSCFW